MRVCMRLPVSIHARLFIRTLYLWRCDEEREIEKELCRICLCNVAKCVTFIVVHSNFASAQFTVHNSTVYTQYTFSRTSRAISVIVGIIL